MGGGPGPAFKHVFYTRLLAGLKARGKTVLVITHDDKYFDVADRIIKLDYGKLVWRAGTGGAVAKRGTGGEVLQKNEKAES